MRSWIVVSAVLLATAALANERGPRDGETPRGGDRPRDSDKRDRARSPETGRLIAAR